MKQPILWLISGCLSNMLHITNSSVWNHPNLGGTKQMILFQWVKIRALYCVYPVYHCIFAPVDKPPTNPANMYVYLVTAIVII